jgi:AraC family cel operon transcriptional repressor
VIRKELFIEACSFLSPNLYARICDHLIPTKTSVSLEKISSFEHKIKLIGQVPPSKFEQKTILIRSLLISLLEPFLSQDVESYFNNYPAWFNQLLNNFNKIEFMQEGLPRIIEYCNYDKKYLCHVFKKYMGVTMTDYLNDIRLNYALELLNNTNKTISNIAQHLGFSSVSYFNVIFKKKYGTSPKELRKNKR